jgi:hypothetical protein
MANCQATLVETRSSFQTLFWETHSFFMMVSLTILIELILKLEAYQFVNELLCALHNVSSLVDKVTATVFLNPVCLFDYRVLI